MVKERWTHSNTTVYNIGYHIIWCPKYRRKVLQFPVSDRLEVLLRERADEIGGCHRNNGDNARSSPFVCQSKTYRESTLDCTTVEGVYIEDTPTGVRVIENALAVIVDS